MKKRTLQKWADFTKCYVATDKYGTYITSHKPTIGEFGWSFVFGSSVHTLSDNEVVPFEGDWKDSLHVPIRED
jgi:hypothetical protein